MIPERYLLYLDVLGFSALAQKPDRVLDLYQIIDRLHVHQHDAFSGIVFSDTLLVYNIDHPRSVYDRQYYVMYLAEFAQDLLYRLIGRDYYFRAILTRGQFLHQKLSNVDAFFGEALINASGAEKSLVGCGLFIDDRILSDNHIFPTRRHCSKYHYMFLTQDIQKASEYGRDGFPFSGDILDATTTTIPTYAQLRFLADIHHKASTHEDPRVRSKFQATWVFYEQQYPALCAAFHSSGFDCSAIATADWKTAQEHYERELISDYYKFESQP